MSITAHPALTSAVRTRSAYLVLLGMLAVSACGGGGSSDAKGNTAPQSDTSSAATDASAGSSGSSTLAAVDSCTLLTTADFAAATDKTQPASFPASKYTLRTEKTKTDVGPAVEQHAACTYYFSGAPGDTGELTLDVMTAAEYKSLGVFVTGKPISGLGDEAALYGERPAFRRGDRGALIANSSSSTDFGTELLRQLAKHF